MAQRISHCYPEKLNIHIQLMSIMLDGVEKYLLGDSVLQDNTLLDPLKYSSEYRELVHQQNAIGWLNFMRGRWSLEWTRLQFVKTKKRLQVGKGTTSKGNWAATIIRIMWDSIYAAWTQRNNERHGTDKETHNAAEWLLLQREIKSLYESQHTFPDECQVVFDTPLEDLLTQSTYHLFHWLETWRPVLEKAASRPKFQTDMRRHYASQDKYLPDCEEAFRLPVEELLLQSTHSLFTWLETWNPIFERIGP